MDTINIGKKREVFWDNYIVDEEKSTTIFRSIKPEKKEEGPTIIKPAAPSEDEENSTEEGSSVEEKVEEPVKKVETKTASKKTTTNTTKGAGKNAGKNTKGKSTGAKGKSSKNGKGSKSKNANKAALKDGNPETQSRYDGNGNRKNRIWKRPRVFRFQKESEQPYEPYPYYRSRYPLPYHTDSL